MQVQGWAERRVQELVRSLCVGYPANAAPVQLQSEQTSESRILVGRSSFPLCFYMMDAWANSTRCS